MGVGFEPRPWRPDSGKRRPAKAAVGRIRARQARRLSGNLLLAEPTGRNLAVDALREKRGNKYTAPPAARHQGEDIGQEILDGIREIKHGGGHRFTVDVPDDVHAIRERMNLTQTAFAAPRGFRAHAARLGTGTPSAAWRRSFPAARCRQAPPRIVELTRVRTAEQ